MPARGLLLLPFLLTPIVSFQFRMLNATIAPDLVAEFGLGPAELGLITSAFFIGFAAAQLPMGLLLDRYGPRPVVVWLQIIGAAGGMVFLLADGQPGLLAGRALIGVGMAGSVMAGLKAANLWFDRARLPAIGALLFGMTGVGGMLATGPLAVLLKSIDWRTAMAGICIFCCVIAVIAYRLIPDAPRPATRQRLLPQIAEIGRLYASGVFLRFPPATVAVIASYTSYQSLWTAIWLRDMEGYGREAQAWALFTLMAAMMLGNFTLGALNGPLQRRGVSTLTVALTAMFGMVALQAAIAAGLAPASLPFWTAVGFLSSGPIAMFAIVSSRFPVEIAGRCSTALNLLGFFGGFLIQSGVGVVLDRFPVAADGRYDPVGHRTALGLIVALQIAGLAWFFLARGLDRPAPVATERKDRP